MKLHITIFISCILISCDSSFNQKRKIIDNKTPLEIKNKVDSQSDTLYTHFINKLEYIQKNIQFERDLVKDTYICHLDFKTYFSEFDKLQIDSNWTLESHYRHFGSAGRALILAFENSSKLADSIKNELNLNIDEEKHPELSEWHISKKLFAYQDSINYLDAIHISNENIGYFQFIVFALIGDNYCKFWHSNYGELSIITSSNQLKKLTELKDDFYYKFSSSEIENILKLVPTPSIISNEKQVEIEILTLSPWEGFVRKKFIVSKQWPHKIKSIQKDTLVEYNCGIMF